MDWRSEFRVLEQLLAVLAGGNKSKLLPKLVGCILLAPVFDSALVSPIAFHSSSSAPSTFTSYLHNWLPLTVFLYFLSPFLAQDFLTSPLPRLCKHQVRDSAHRSKLLSSYPCGLWKVSYLSSSQLVHCEKERCLLKQSFATLEGNLWKSYWTYFATQGPGQKLKPSKNLKLIAFQHEGTYL